ncbi:unnamed protein product, partial [Meganyctiphanes norvegica]
MMSKYSVRQWLVLSVLTLANVFEASNASIMAPFFPPEAEAKDVSPTIYGFIFGVYTLVMCVMSPIYGKLINRVGLKNMFNVGLFVSSLACTTFAFVGYIYNKQIFIGFSFINRIIGAAGHAAFTCGSFTITAKEFPNNVGFAFGILELGFGLGLMIGPVIGGALYELGGFVVPFTGIGLLVMTFSFLSMGFLPGDKDEISTSKDLSSTTGFMSIIRIPSSGIFLFALFAGATCKGYLLTGLEVHIRQFKLSPLEIGAIFMVEGGFYSLTAPLWGKASGIIKSPLTVLLFACSVVFASFLIIGPVPFLPLAPSIPLVISALAMFGFGLSGIMVVSFEGVLLAAKNYGFADNIGTHGLVSGIFVSTFSFGYFIGSSIGGILLDNFGFSMGTTVPIVMLCVVFISFIIY